MDKVINSILTYHHKLPREYIVGKSKYINLTFIERCIINEQYRELNYRYGVYKHSFGGNQSRLYYRLNPNVWDNHTNFIKVFN